MVESNDENQKAGQCGTIRKKNNSIRLISWRLGQATWLRQELVEKNT